MGIASLVLGIISIILGIIPFCGVFAFIPAVVGLALAIAELVRPTDKESHAIEIAGLILNILALVFIIFWIFVYAVVHH